MPGERPLTDRRSYLKYAGVAAISALAGCGGGGNGDGDSGPNHMVPHPDDNTIPDAEVNANSLGGQARPNEPSNSKDSVNFAHEPDGENYCGNCSLFVPDADGDDFGACLVVQGKIHHCDYCSLWSPYDGDDVVTCEG